MSKVYLINVGANTAHASAARSPPFKNGSFRYVPFFEKKVKKGIDGYHYYHPSVRPFVRREKLRKRRPHNDPDWINLTYGDCCTAKRPRASALLKVENDDILLFWALLWPNTGAAWEQFTGKRYWGLIGALRVRETLKPGQKPADASTPSRRTRAGQNVHFWGARLAPHNYVFIGCTKHSCPFPKMVDLEVGNSRGLLCRTIRSKHGERLVPNGKPRWSSSMRACRAVWDLGHPKGRKRAEILRDVIKKQTGYDLLRGL